MPKLESVTIDPRRHDAVLLDAAVGATEALTRKLHDVGVRTGTYSSADG
ncbi:MAG: trehalose phosphatase, partial [Mycobacterium sp.]